LHPLSTVARQTGAEREANPRALQKAVIRDYAPSGVIDSALSCGQ
jgi:hypothetical protein